MRERVRGRTAETLEQGSEIGASGENRQKLLNPLAKVGVSIWSLHRITEDLGRGKKALCNIKNNKTQVGKNMLCCFFFTLQRLGLSQV